MIEDTDARIQGALVLLLLCGAYACAVQYSLVSDAILLSDRGPTKTARLLKLSQSLVQRNFAAEPASYLLPD